MSEELVPKIFPDPAARRVLPFNPIPTGVEKYTAVRNLPKAVHLRLWLLGSCIKCLRVLFSTLIPLKFCSFGFCLR